MRSTSLSINPYTFINPQHGTQNTERRTQNNQLQIYNKALTW